MFGEAQVGLFPNTTEKKVKFGLFMLPISPERDRTGPRQVYPGTIWDLWGFYFMQEIIQDTTPTDFATMFNKGWVSKTKE